MVRPRGRSAEIDEMLTIAPPFAVLDHGGNRVFGKQEHCLDVDPHYAPILLGVLVDDAAAAADADIVVEEVEPAPAVDGGLDQPLAFGLNGDVAGQRRSAATLGLDHFDRSPGKPRIEIGHHHLGTGPRQQDRRGPAVADTIPRGAATADDRDLVSQASVVLAIFH